MSRLRWLNSQDWPCPENVRACFTFRDKLNESTSSIPPFNTFNLGDHVGDNPLVVEQNRLQLLSDIGVDQIVWLKQIHGTTVADLSQGKRISPITADASECVEPGIAACVMTADCLPVFLCDKDPASQQANRVAVVHAGWRGLQQGVISETLKTFSNPSQVMAYLGPAISQRHFEVGDEVKQLFVETFSADAEKNFIRSPSSSDKWMADIYGLATLNLTQLGVSQITGGQYCTYSDENNFFSYRRDGQTGRMAHLIWLAKD